MGLVVKMSDFWGVLHRNQYDFVIFPCNMQYYPVTLAFSIYLSILKKQYYHIISYSKIKKGGSLVFGDITGYYRILHKNITL